MVNKKGLCRMCLKPGHYVRECQSKFPCSDCGSEEHNSVLHGGKMEFTRVPKKNDPPSKKKQNDPKKEEEHMVGTVAEVNMISGEVPSLRYVMVEVEGPKGKEEVLALLDEGSELFLCEEDIINNVGITGPTYRLGLNTVAGRRVEQSKRVEIKLRRLGQEGFYGVRNVRTVKNLDLKPATLNADKIRKKYPHLKNIPLKSFYGLKPRMIVGSTHYDLYEHLKTVRGKPGQPIAVKSKLGWSVKDTVESNTVEGASYHICCEYIDQELHELVKNNFALDEFGLKQAGAEMSKEDTRVMEILENSAVRVPGKNNFEVALPWRDPSKRLPDSKNMALRRLYTLEKKMDRDAGYAGAYWDKIKEYLDKGYISKVGKVGATDKVWYLPHFGVYNPNKPGKLRLVFDAAAKSHGISLNDCLLQGPDLNKPLVTVLLKFRQYGVAFVGDIKEMFHQVVIREEDRSAQRLLWRGMERQKAPEEYQINVMIFGATSSPSMAQFIKNKNATEYEDKYPEAATAIKEKTYVDDYLDSVATQEEAIKRIKEVCDIHEQGGFHICNFVSNSPEVLKTVPEERRAKGVQQVNFGDADLPEGRVLGLLWDPNEDYFRFRLQFHKVPQEIVDGKKRPTKRQVLKLVMSVFDPLGFISHFVVKGRILLQEIWRSGIGWDDKIPGDLEGKWDDWVEELQGIVEVRIARCYSMWIPKATSIQLHIFVDASQQAYCGVAFLRVKCNDDLHVKILYSKVKVAPLKPVSIPRLELCAAVLGAKMKQAIIKDLEIKIDTTTFWTDSTTLLRWIRNDTRRFKQFVGARVGTILEKSEVGEWRYVPTKLNVADDGTRNNKETDFNPGARWFVGEGFLYQEESEWPQDPIRDEEGEDDEVEMVKVNTISSEDILPLKYSSYLKQVRVTAWVLRYIGNLGIRVQNRNKVETRKDGGGDAAQVKISKKWDRNIKKKEEIAVPCLTLEEITRGNEYWIKRAQEDSFPEEVGQLYGGKLVNKGSPLFKLSPFLGEDGVIRMSGRLNNAKFLPEESKTPVILSSKHLFTQLLISHMHEQCGHQGRKTVESELQKKYWIVGLTSGVKRAFRDCQWCKIRRAKPVVPEMGQLPWARLQPHIRPFTNTGMDYWGPVEVVIGRRHEKRWGGLIYLLIN